MSQNQPPNTPPGVDSPAPDGEEDESELLPFGPVPRVDSPCDSDN